MEQTPTWAIAVACFVLVFISILIEHAIHILGKGKAAFASTKAIYQLHIFIFVLAVCHVLYCIIIYALGRTKMKQWKAWENETKTTEYQKQNDPETLSFRFTKDTSFGRRHLNFWSCSSLSVWIVCFFRQFFGSVTKTDYLTLRHGFIMAHLAPENESKFDFHKYIKRSLDYDFKEIILMVGTKLQVIITNMGLSTQDKGEVVRGRPRVQPGDNLFWFESPRFLLFLIHVVLFTNAFQLAFFLWSTYEFSLRSCYHQRLVNIIIRVSMGVIIQLLCSYVTLPLYALVNQLGTNMSPAIFSERVAVALKDWHHEAKKQSKHGSHSENTTPISSRPETPMLVINTELWP
ncbi:hypothetical protein DITRI_Ditri12bG0087300 [Diplodiscus trichospermus]